MYMSPEVMFNDNPFTTKADIWAVGIMMYQLCTQGLFLFLSLTLFSFLLIISIHSSFFSLSRHPFGCHTQEELIKYDILLMI